MLYNNILYVYDKRSEQVHTFSEFRTSTNIIIVIIINGMRGGIHYALMFFSPRITLYYSCKHYEHHIKIS